MAAILQGKKGRVLCVDDEPHVLRALQWLLQKDFEIHTASSAQEGLRLLQQHDFDVVVSDQRMPAVTGVEFLRDVRKAAPRAMRILLTGYSDLDAMVRSVNESEVFRFITKPWDIRELPKLITEAAEIARTEPVASAEPAQLAAGNVTPIRAGGAPAAPAAPQHQVTTVAVHPPVHMLVIHDNPEVHKAIRALLGKEATLHHALNLLDAVRLLKDKPIGVVCSEVTVAKLDATRLVRLAKAKHPEIVSVMLSDQADAELVIALINQGQVYRFIPKPYKPAFIKLVLESAIKRHRQLMATPGLQRRFSVEAAPQEAGATLAQDLKQAASAAG